MRVIQLLLVCILGSTTWANAATDATVNPPTFAKDDGTTFTEPYNLGLSADEGLAIYVTTDGTDPVIDGKLSPKAVPYNEDAKYQNAGTYKAVTVDADGNISEIVTRQFKYSGYIIPPYYENFDQGLVNFHNTTSATGAPFWDLVTDVTPNYATAHEMEGRWAKAGTGSLYTPIIDLSNCSSASMNFSHWGNNFNGKASEYCKVYVREASDRENEDIATDWTPLNIINWFTDGSDKVNSGDINIDLTNYSTKKIQLKFELTTDNNTKGTWNIAKFVVLGVAAAEEKHETVNFAEGGWYTYVVENDIDAVKTQDSEHNTTDHFIYLYKVPQFTKSQAVFQRFGVEDNDNSEKVIKAGTPIAVFVDANQTTTYDLVIANTADQVPEVKNNLLHPSIDGAVKATEQTDFRVLGYKNNVPGFYRLAAGKTVGKPNKTPKDRKAYLNFTEVSDGITWTSNAAKGVVVWGEKTTGIDDIVATQHPATRRIYTLSGQNAGNDLETLPSGIYIVNGKKIVK